MQEPYPHPMASRLAVAAIVVAAAPAAAQSLAPDVEEVTARVTAFVQGTGIVIDRGVRDGLEVGDRVTFTERGGREQFGTITELEGRGATVRPEDPSFRPGAGTRATISVPASRFESEPKGPKPKVPVPTDNGGGSGRAKPKDGGSIGDRWTREDDGFTMDMPLLAEVKAVDPVDRASRLSGRAYLAWDRIVDTEDERGDSFLRTGGALLGENLFGKGGTLHFDAEFNARRTQEPGERDESESTMRLDRLSYTLGGTRHDWNRVQFGRFLQYDMPEFGVLDGAAWSQRSERGDTYGASLGFLPEPDKDQRSLEDLQVAAWYRWVADERELLSITGGYQKTWHNGDADRDLVILKTQYIPEEGWNIFGTAWIDLYLDDEAIRGGGPSLSYMVLDGRRQFEDDLALNLDYRHQEYPDLIRREYPPVSPDQIQDAHVDRIGGTLSKWTRKGGSGPRSKRWYVRLGGWADEEDAGGDAEFGVDLLDFLYDDARLDLATFTSQAKFSSVLGARMRFGRYGPKRSWSIGYEVRLNDITGFDSGNDNLYQHRGRGSYELFRSDGTSLSVTGQIQFQDREDQAFLGLFLQRSF